MASSTSSHLHKTKYDVFISFRGIDTRHGFLSHLIKELRHKKIDAYVDERLESGEEISLALIKAIEESKISLVIFSKNYATSKWCLEELVKIMECNKVNDQIVMPIFYNIDPTDVRHQNGTYKDAFDQHEQNFKHNIDKVYSWRSALHKAANLSGYHYSNFENESKLIDQMVEDVLNKLSNDISPNESTRFVKLDENVALVQSLSNACSEQVRIIGIWGMAGIGKTTVAQAVCFSFGSRCIMENVREESNKINGLRKLILKLYSQILDEEKFDMNDAQEKPSIKRRLSGERVLIVLDDVDTSEQLEYLVGELKYLGQESRVIVTSRDKHVLNSRGVHAIHEIGELNFQDSLELFSLYAFNKRQPKMGYEELSKSAVLNAKGSPLALKVLGIHLRSRNIETWEREVEKLRKHPRKQIQNVLKMSYDGLDESEKNIFLDIAFFFKGHPKGNVIAVLDACGYCATSGISHLLDKALITISGDNRIKMHDLLQETGEQIVCEESLKHPERRSRLKDKEEVYDVFQNKMGADKIEGIVLDVSQIRDVCLSVDTFKKLPNLRILKMYSEHWCEESNVNVPLGLETFSNNLSYFHWDLYPLESIPQTFYTEKLVEIHMERSQLKRLWDGVKDLLNLKILNLKGSKQLIELPDLSKATNLESLLLGSCHNLSEIPDNISSLSLLKHLDVSESNVECLPCMKHLLKLQHLGLKSCKRLRSIPELPPSVRILQAQFCPSLETIIPFTTCMIEDNNGDTEKLDLSFNESLNLDEQYAMHFTNLSMMLAINSNFSDHEHEAIYPGSTIPRWFRYRETTRVEYHSFTIEIAPTYQLLGLLLCGILPRLNSNKSCTLCFSLFPRDVFMRCCVKVFRSEEWITKDHVCLWFCPFQKIWPSGITRKFTGIIECQCTCEIPDEGMLVSEFFNEGVAGIAYGACPIYASKYDNTIEQILESWSESGMKPTMGHGDNIDVHQQLPLKLKESSNDTDDDNPDEQHFQIKLNPLNNLPPLDKEIEKQQESKGLDDLLLLIMMALLVGFSKDHGSRIAFGRLGLIITLFFIFPQVVGL